MHEQDFDFEEAVEIANEALGTDIEIENSKKKFKSVHKKGGHNRCNKTQW